MGKGLGKSLLEILLICWLFPLGLTGPDFHQSLHHHSLHLFSVRFKLLHSSLDPLLCFLLLKEPSRNLFFTPSTLLGQSNSAESPPPCGGPTFTMHPDLSAGPAQGPVHSHSHKHKAAGQRLTSTSDNASLKARAARVDLILNSNKHLSINHPLQPYAGLGTP